MALTRKMLRAFGIEDDKIDEIISAHTDTVNALKADVDRYKADAEKLIETQNELEELKKNSEGNDSYKERYEQEHKAFEDYKVAVDAEKVKAKKVDAYKNLLKETGVSEKRLDAIVRLAELDKIELEDDGSIKDAKTVQEDIKKEWSDYIVKEDTKGAGTENPPNNGGEGGAKHMSRAAQIVAKHNEMLYGTKGDKK